MRKFIFIIGLPGSGKSHLIKEEYSSEDWVCYDDYHDKALFDRPDFSLSKNYPSLINELIKGNKNIILSDIAFCEKGRLNEALKTIQYWKETYSIQIDIEYIYFENEAFKCIDNIKGHAQKRIEKVDEFEVKYKIPSHVKQRTIWTKT